MLLVCCLHLKSVFSQAVHSSTNTVQYRGITEQEGRTRSSRWPVQTIPCYEQDQTVLPTAVEKPKARWFVLSQTLHGSWDETQLKAGCMMPGEKHSCNLQATLRLIHTPLKSHLEKRVETGAQSFWVGNKKKKQYHTLIKQSLLKAWIKPGLIKQNCTGVTATNWTAVNISYTGRCIDVICASFCLFVLHRVVLYCHPGSLSITLMIANGSIFSLPYLQGGVVHPQNCWPTERKLLTLGCYCFSSTLASLTLEQGHFIMGCPADTLPSKGLSDEGEGNK